MKHLPSGLSRGLDFILPDDWTPEQALAVVELLDDLRERIYSHYLLAFQDVIQRDRAPLPPPPHNGDTGDPF